MRLLLLQMLRPLLLTHFGAQLSFSQTGEDQLLLRCLLRLGIRNGSYLDIGANDPIRLNNTVLLYLQGFRGVLVEPMPKLAAELRTARPEDRVLNVGIAPQPAPEAVLHIMSNPFLHTFSREEAERIQQRGNARIVDTVKVPTVTVNEVMAEHFDGCPNLVSLDAEGMDEQIIESFDFERFRPELFCVETIDCSHSEQDQSNDRIGEILQSHGYAQYADLSINRIFVDAEKWKRRYDRK